MGTMISEALERKIKQIENGQYTFAEICSFNDRKIIEDILLKKLDDGSIADDGKVALAKYECDEIIKGRKELDDLPKNIRSVIEGNENYMNYLKNHQK